MNQVEDRRSCGAGMESGAGMTSGAGSTSGSGSTSGLKATGSWVRGVVLACVSTASIAMADPPAGYYDSAAGLTGEALRLELHEIIDDHQRFPYTSSATDTWDIVAAANEDPSNSNNVLTIYRNKTALKSDHSSGTGWNREHSWPNSYGFSQDGSCNYPYTDCHQLFPADWGYNSSRGNNPYDDCLSGCTPLSVDGYPSLFNYRDGNGSFGTWEAWDLSKGDVARAMLYMSVRYEGGTHGSTGCSEPDLRLTDNRNLIISNTSSNYSPAYMGVISTLLEWHLADPPDDFERDRNDVVASYQGNRNPFVDHPEWVCEIWGCSGGDMTPPDAPTALVATGAACGIDLDWNDNGEVDLAGYHVYRATSSGGPYQRINGTLVNDSDFFDDSAAQGSSYWYLTTAVDLSGNESADSNIDSAMRDGTPCEVASTPWINEFHYDNTSTDTGEMIEIAGPAGTDLTGYSLVGYNGATSVIYDTVVLSGVLPNQQAGFGTAWFPFTGLQNGAPDGVALVDDQGVVIQFLSYEGSFVASGGPASGMMSEDVLVSESSATPIGHSLQLTGTGSSYDDFTWQAPMANTQGQPNTGQTFVAPSAIADCQGVDGIDVLTIYTNGSDVESGYTVVADAGDPLAFEIVKPAGMGNGKFLAHMNTGAPTAGTITTLPAQLGDMCFAALLPPFGSAAPVAVWNNIGKINRVGSSNFFGVSSADPARAPTTFYSVASVDLANMPIGSTWTLQAVILNPAATSPKGASVSDAIVLEIQ